MKYGFVLLTLCLFGLFSFAQSHTHGGTTFSPDSQAEEICAEHKPGKTAPPISIILYPNPASDYMWIHYGIPEAKDLELQIVHSTGLAVVDRTFASKSGYHDLSFALKDWPSGTYYVHLSNDDYHTTHKLIVK